MRGLAAAEDFFGRLACLARILYTLACTDFPFPIISQLLNEYAKLVG